jgi:hypothetical protein
MSRGRMLAWSVATEERCQAAPTGAKFITTPAGNFATLRRPNRTLQFSWYRNDESVIAISVISELKCVPGRGKKFPKKSKDFHTV